MVNDLISFAGITSAGFTGATPNEPINISYVGRCGGASAKKILNFEVLSITAFGDGPK